MGRGGGATGSNSSRTNKSQTRDPEENNCGEKEHKRMCRRRRKGREAKHTNNLQLSLYPSPATVVVPTDCGLYSRCGI